MAYNCQLRKGLLMISRLWCRSGLCSLFVMAALGFWSAKMASAADFDQGLMASQIFRAPDATDLGRLGTEVLGAEDFSSEGNSPRIPEPLVFDLVRPLGAKRGELEVNTLALIPLNRRATSTGIPNPIGLVPSDRPRPEWAPEIEYAIADGIAIEFEFPFEETTLAAYKTSCQVTFGTAFDERFIHGAQGILLYDKQSGKWSPVLVYIAGVRLDERWSTLWMYGFRTEINGDDTAERTERLINGSIFYDLNYHVTLGFETNWAQSLKGGGSLLATPQLHWEITDHWMLQSGVGIKFNSKSTLPELGIRLIRSF